MFSDTAAPPQAPAESITRSSGVMAIGTLASRGTGMLRTLVQAYTGFVYGGPLWPRRVLRELAG